MAERQDTDLTPPLAPALQAPREEAVLDGSHITFRWADVDGAAEYVLEVATDPAFEQVVHTETTTDTSATVTEAFTTDGTTHFWRVIARNEAGESHGENIESFISVTPDVAHQHHARPDQAERLGPLGEAMTEKSPMGRRATAKPASKGAELEHPDKEEDLGPAPELLKAVSAGVAAEVTEDEDYYEKEAELGVQHEGIGVAAVMGFMLAIVVVLAMAVVFVFYLTQMASQQALSDVTALQTYPQLREVEVTAARQLEQYEVIDPEAGVYQIPIDRAIDLMVNEAYENPRTDYSSELQLRPRN